MADLDEQIEHARQRLRILQVKAHQQKRRGDTRRKIIYGAAALALAKELEDDKADRFFTRLHAKITRPSDRNFLGLSEK